MSKTLIIVSGISGSGKTFYTDILGYPHIHFDEIFSYQKKILHFSPIKNMILNNSTSDIFVLDAYMFHLDLDIVKLKKELGELIDVYELHFLYTNLPDLYQYQVDKSNLSKGYKVPPTSEEGTKVNIEGTLMLGNYIFSAYKRNEINKLYFFYRNKTKYSNENKEHFLRTLGV